MNSYKAPAGYDSSLPSTITEARKLLDEVETFLLSETYLAFQRYMGEEEKNGTKSITNMIPGSVFDIFGREQAIGVLAKLPEYLQWFELRRQIILDHIEALSALLQNTNADHNES